MKHDAWRLDPAPYPLRGSLQPRWSDVDRWQHLNNSALVAMHGENIQRWLQQQFGAQVWRQTAPAWLTVAHATDFLAEGQYPDALDTGVRLTHVVGPAPAPGRDSRDGREGPDGPSLPPGPAHTGRVTPSPAAPAVAPMAQGHLVLASALWQGGRCIGRHQAWLQPWQGRQPLAPWPPALLAQLQAVHAAQPPLPPPLTAPSAPPSPSAPSPQSPGLLQPPSPAPTPSAGLPPRPPLADVAPRLGDFAWQAGLASRYGDHDALDHTADAALVRCAEQIRVEFLTQALGAQRRQSPTGFMVGHVALRRLAPGPAPAQWRVGCGITRLGDRSLALRGALYADDRPDAAPQAVFEAVLVAVDRARRRATALPDWVRAGLSPWQLPAGPAVPGDAGAAR